MPVLYMIRWINKQPGIQKFWKYAVTINFRIAMTEYHYLINRQTDGLF